MNEMTNQLTATAVKYIMIFGFLSILTTVFKLFFLPKIKGRLGETNINFWIQWLLGRPVFHLIPDV